MGHKHFTNCISTIRPKYLVQYEKKLKPKKHPILVRLMNPPSFYTPWVLHINAMLREFTEMFRKTPDVNARPYYLMICYDMILDINIL